MGHEKGRGIQNGERERNKKRRDEGSGKGEK